MPTVVPDPASTDPAPTDPAPTNPASTDPASTDPASTDPASTDPASTNPASTNPGPATQAPTAIQAIHQARELAESFGSDAARYDRARPRYPDALIAQVVAASPGPEILDVGCGTGIAGRQLQSAGCRVLGVDVDARMADFARRRGLDVDVASFESWDDAGRRFDAVTSGMAWHWVDPVAGAAKAARLLRPGGLLAPFWYVFDPAADLAQAFADVYRRVLPDSPLVAGVMPGLKRYSVIFDKAVDGIRQTGAFSEPAQSRFEWSHRYTRDEWLGMVSTAGGHSGLSPDKQDELLAGIGAVVDDMGGSFTMPCAAVVVMATRTS